MALLSGLWALWTCLKSCLGLSLRCCAVMRNYGPLTPALLPAIAPRWWSWQENFNRWLRRNKYFDPHAERRENEEPSPPVGERRRRRPIFKGMSVPDERRTPRRHRRQHSIHGDRDPMLAGGFSDALRNGGDGETQNYENICLRPTSTAPPPHYPDLQETVDRPDPRIIQLGDQDLSLPPRAAH